MVANLLGVTADLLGLMADFLGVTANLQSVCSLDTPLTTLSDNPPNFFPLAIRSMNHLTQNISHNNCKHQ